MNKKSRIIELIFLLVLIFGGNILMHTVGISSALLFWGALILAYALFWHKNKKWELDEKYHDMKEANIRQRYSVFGLIFLGALCLLCGVITWHDDSLMSLLVFMLLAVISLIPAYIIDRKFWAKVPREERPWAYRGIKSKEDNIEG